MTLLLSVFFIKISSAQVRIIPHTDRNINLRLSELYEDTSGEISPSHVIGNDAIKFDSLTPKNAIARHTKSVYWVRFSLSQASTAEYAMVQVSRFDDIRLYIPRDSGKYEEQKTGFSYSLANRSIYHNEGVFEIPVLSGKNDYYYMSMRTNAPSNFGISIIMTPAGYFLSQTFRRTIYIGFFFGIIFLAVLYSLILFIRIRESAYFFYALYVFSFGLFAMMDWGLIVEIPFVSSTGWNKNFYTIPFVTMTCALLLYARSFLDTKDNLPVMHKILTLLVYGRILLYFVGLIGDINAVYNPAYDDLFLLAAFVTGFIRMGQGYKPAAYFIVAFAIAYTGFFFHAFSYFLPYFKISTTLPRLLSLYNTGIFEIILFSFGLAERFRYLKQEKDVINLQTIQYLQENNKLKDASILQLQENLKLKEDVQKVSKDRVMQKRVSFEEFKQIYPDDEACYKFVEDLKWGKGFICPKCANTKYSKGNTAYSRRCSRCNHIERLFTGTVFSGIKFPITKAFYLLFFVSSGKNITVDELSLSLDLRKQTCWSFRKKLQESINLKKNKQKTKDGWSHLILTDLNADE